MLIHRTRNHIFATIVQLKRNYTTIITACLLALYAFVAMPVSYWHQHKTVSDKYPAAQQSKMVKKSTSAIDANCKICSHHYSVANNDAITLHFSTLSFFTLFNSFFILNTITNPGYSKSNKGPPAIA